MKTARTLLIVLPLLGFSALAAYVFVILRAESAPTTASDRFPILSRFELPRSYGYFIGDEIPLTLVIETTGGVVLDLVNLPQKGEKHGLFEVRDLNITSTSPSHDRQVYRAAYTLQYFGITPLTAQFEGMEILYALPDERFGPKNTYTYKSLFTQPVAINLSRIGPFRSTQPIDIKGPLDDKRAGLVCASFTVGTVLLLITLSGWVMQWRRRRQQQQRTSIHTMPSAAEITLRALRQEAAALHPVDPPTFAVGPRLTHIIREYLQAAFTVPAFALTTAELEGHLKDQPFCQELLYVLERCDTLKHQFPTGSEAEERQLWGEVMTLFEKLHQADAT
jgi:hypothetical protein